MSVWLIEPRDPLIARDGRPARLGGPLSTLGFPFPSTIAGAVRTRLASRNGSFTLSAGEIAELVRIPVHGPLLAELSDDAGEVSGWLAPAPRDAQIVSGPELLRLRPRDAGTGACDSLKRAELLPVAASVPVDRKPPRDLPAIWHWERFAEWLHDPPARSAVDLALLGLPKLLVERRSHVSIAPGERVGVDGMLFETAGMRFLQPRKSGDQAPRFCVRQLALGLRCPGGPVGDRNLQLTPQIAPLGGERRLARWRPAGQPWPELPAEVRSAIVKSGRARLVLLTPACFSQGALPGWNKGSMPGLSGLAVTATVRAACVPRPEIVSGWDLAQNNAPGQAKGQAKPTRRLAAAGSVYFLELEGSEDDLGRWCDAVWLSPVSDGEQDRRDGFGLAALGAWLHEGDKA